MSLLALDQALLGQPMHGRFLSDPQMRASLLLLQERIPLAEVRTRIDMTRAEPSLKHASDAVDASVRTFTTADTAAPEVHLLSNGRYHVMITAAGSGASRWQDLALTRWQEDATRDHWGTFLYLRDLDSGTFWSATPQPTGCRFDRYEAQFSQGVAEFRATREDIQVHMRVAVSSEEDVELRRLIVSNLSNRERHIEIISYAEVALLNGPNASEQPAFNGLFIEAEALPAKAAVICSASNPVARGELAAVLPWDDRASPARLRGREVRDRPLALSGPRPDDRPTRRHGRRHPRTPAAPLSIP